MGKNNKSKKTTPETGESGNSVSSETDTMPEMNHDPTGIGNVTQYEKGMLSLEVSPVLGRYLKTLRNIKKGELLFAEKYLIAGPQRSSDIVCVGCHADFEEDQERLVCEACQWPICEVDCATSVFHKDECKFFVENDIKPPTKPGTCDYGALAVLRGLMLKLFNPGDWKKLTYLEAHNDIRKDRPLWRENTINVVNVILLDWDLEKYFTEEEVHTVCGIMEVNSFELGDNENVSARAILPYASLMAHDCVPNTTHFQNALEGILEFRAAIDIPAGEPLAICYAFSLEGSTQRRRLLLETKFFECCCKRCSDPTELGTFMSGVVCQTCRKGYAYNTGAPELAEIWVCENCNVRLPLQYIDTLVENWQEVMVRVYDIPSSEKFVENCKSVFHPNHYIPFGVKFNMCQAYGRESTELQYISPDDLDRKLELCREVLEVLNVVTPGYTITRGMVLYELQAAEIIYLRRYKDKLKPAVLRRKLQLTLKTLKDAIAILELQHPSTIEYEIAQLAKRETLTDLMKWINRLK